MEDRKVWFQRLFTRDKDGHVQCKFQPDTTVSLPPVHRLIKNKPKDCRERITEKCYVKREGFQLVESLLRSSACGYHRGQAGERYPGRREVHGAVHVECGCLGPWAVHSVYTGSGSVAWRRCGESVRTYFWKFCCR